MRFQVAERVDLLPGKLNVDDRAGLVSRAVLCCHIKRTYTKRPHRKAGASWMFCVSNRPTAKTATNASGSYLSSSPIRVYQARTDHFQRLHSLRQLRVRLSAARQGRHQRRRADPGRTDRVRPGRYSVDSSYIAYFDTLGFAGIAEPLKSSALQRHETAEGAYLVKKELESSPPSRVMRQSLRPADDRALCGKHLPEAPAVPGPGALTDADRRTPLLRKALSRRDHCLCQPLHFQERGDDAL